MPRDNEQASAGAGEPAPSTPSSHEAEGPVACTVEDDVALVTMRQPPHNLLTEPMLRVLADVLESLVGGCRAVVLCSEGRSFCAGANFRSESAPDPADEGGFEQAARAFYDQAIRIFSSPLPMVAAVHGPAIGAGLGLALACDLRVVGEGGWFQANFVRLGIHPGFALSHTLPRLIGVGKASDMLLTGRKVGADEAERIGLADRKVPEGEETADARALALEVAQAAPLAVSATRATLRHGLVDEVRTTLAHELAEQARLAGSADAIEGVSAMLERRQPVFRGR